ncbi:hypothetical protein C7M84_011004 [Penaeus vannamei]|uniref:Uncharacterized protein n=1 Tax=Penaeus vannamei TaxID=6689 RepID=A0A3R7M395_PENVA|nr:hypothetical protein C7M84_011004 [Penaeus vannamei]
MSQHSSDKSPTAPFPSRTSLALPSAPLLWSISPTSIPLPPLHPSSSSLSIFLPFLPLSWSITFCLFPFFPFQFVSFFYLPPPLSFAPLSLPSSPTHLFPYPLLFLNSFQPLHSFSKMMFLLEAGLTDHACKSGQRQSYVTSLTSRCSVPANSRAFSASANTCTIPSLLSLPYCLLRAVSLLPPPLLYTFLRISPLFSHFPSPLSILILPSLSSFPILHLSLSPLTFPLLPPSLALSPPSSLPTPPIIPSSSRLSLLLSPPLFFSLPSSSPFFSLPLLLPSPSFFSSSPLPLPPPLPSSSPTSSSSSPFLLPLPFLLLLLLPLLLPPSPFSSALPRRRKRLSGEPPSRIRFSFELYAPWDHLSHKPGDLLFSLLELPYVFFLLRLVCLFV